MANKQIMHSAAGPSFRVYSRHSQKCPHIKDASYLKCACWKWLQYQQDGKPCKKPADTRSVAGLKVAVEKLGLELSGKPPVEPTAPKTITIAVAVEQWLAFRTAESKGNEKADFMGRILREFCQENNATFLHEITTNLMTKFFITVSERYKKGDSSSLKIHWSIIKAFFKWLTEEKLVPENPLPLRKIKFKKPEVEIPATEDMDRILLVANNETTRKEWLFLQTMRWSGMAIIDTAKLSRKQINGTHIEGQRTKTGKRFGVDIPAWLVEALRDSTTEERFFGQDDPRLVVFRMEYSLRPIFKAANTRVKVTAHTFRHFFISQQLALGFSTDEVSDMVGTSAAEIAKTYKHWIKAGRDRVRAKQAAIWVSQGLDENGNPKETVQ